MFLVLTVFALGVRHGLDLDHLAVIDALTRTVKTNTNLSKFAGFLFSLGHGLVVILFSVFLDGKIINAKAPLWLADFGNWISAICLVFFGLMTLSRVLFFKTSLSLDLFVGVRVFFCKKLIGENFNPWLIILIGALFAFSFDTFTQVALFSLTASLMAGFVFSFALAIVFMIGMIMADGLNGFFVNSLIQLAARRSKILSQLIGLSIAFFSLVLGLLGVWRDF